ncbi:outer membrane protein assembly factor BamB family protein [Haladaptatus cibarius]|uniref:outer membrane protein assembly factor BamB family protein n=1 Tax=Haladaptatus cibarius TaxID=453847 RepID=UPI00130E9EDB|nr:PQQ-binding-like beta-propeller repeat protein [Haladaptatus cibarius]
MERDDPAFGGITMPPVVADRTAYATSRTGHIIARGDTEWTVETDTQAGLTPTIAHGIVYAPIASGIVALDPKDGGEQWRTETDAVSRDIGDATPTATNESVILGTEVVSALDKGTGKVQWVGEYPNPTTTWGVATTGKRTIAMTALDGKEGLICCFGPKGNRQWKKTVDVNNAPPRPTISDGTVFAATDTGTLYAVDLKTGSTKWEAEIDDNVKTGLAVTNEIVVVPGATGGTLRAINVADGTARWTQTVGNTTAPAVVNDRVVVGANDISDISETGFAVFDPATGNRTRKYAVGTAGSFTVGDGRIYFCHEADSSLWVVG